MALLGECQRVRAVGGGSIGMQGLPPRPLANRKMIFGATRKKQLRNAFAMLARGSLMSANKDGESFVVRVVSALASGIIL